MSIAMQNMSESPKTLPNFRVHFSIWSKFYPLDYTHFGFLLISIEICQGIELISITYVTV